MGLPVQARRVEAHAASPSPGAWFPNTAHSPHPPNKNTKPGIYCMETGLAHRCTQDYMWYLAGAAHAAGPGN